MYTRRRVRCRHPFPLPPNTHTTTGRSQAASSAPDGAFPSMPSSFKPLETNTKTNTQTTSTRDRQTETDRQTDKTDRQRYRDRDRTYTHKQDRTGQDRTDRTGQRQDRTRTGQDRTGQDRNRTGQDRTGQDRTGQTPPCKTHLTVQVRSTSSSWACRSLSNLTHPHLTDISA